MKGEAFFFYMWLSRMCTFLHIYRTKLTEADQTEQYPTKGSDQFRENRSNLCRNDLDKKTFQAFLELVQNGR